MYRCEESSIVIVAHLHGGVVLFHGHLLFLGLPGRSICLGTAIGDSLPVGIRCACSGRSPRWTRKDRLLDRSGLRLRFRRRLRLLIRAIKFGECVGFGFGVFDFLLEESVNSPNTHSRSCSP